MVGFPEGGWKEGFCLSSSLGGLGAQFPFISRTLFYEGKCIIKNGSVRVSCCLHCSAVLFRFALIVLDKITHFVYSYEI